MSDLERTIRMRLMEGGPKTEAELSDELHVSKADIRQAATANEAVVVVPGQAERTYEYRPLIKGFVEKNRDAGNS